MEAHAVIRTVSDSGVDVRVLMYSHNSNITGQGGPPKLHPTSEVSEEMALNPKPLPALSWVAVKDLNLT